MRLLASCLSLAAASILAAPMARADTVKVEASSAEAPLSPADTGFTAELRLAVMVPVGTADAGERIDDDFSVFGAGMMGEALFAYHFRPTLAVVTGFRLSAAHQGTDCPDNFDCTGWSMQLPLMLRYAPKGRREGFFVEAGLGLLTRYTVRVTQNQGAVQGRVTYFNDFLEGKLGAGYRIPIGRASWDGGIEPFVGVDFGQFSRVAVEFGAAEGVPTDLLPPRRSDNSDGGFHATILAGVGGYFAF